VSESYKSFKGTLEVFDCELDINEYGSLVRWTFEYEKLKEDITGACPDLYLDLVAEVTKDIDYHLELELEKDEQR